MILCVCGHYKSDHQNYFGKRRGRNGDSCCSVPHCECEYYYREDLKKRDDKKKSSFVQGFMPLVRAKRSDVEKSLNRKFRRARK